MDNDYIIAYDGELYHWGIKGMKWGVRRYQNPDGSLTAAGRKRYIGSDGKLTKAGQKYYAKETERLKNERKTLIAQKRAEAKLSKLDEMRSGNNSLKNQVDPKKNDSSKKKSVKDMTDAELITAINRARNEDTYRQLRPESSPKAQSFMDKLMKDAVIPATVDAGKKALTKLVDDMLKTKVDPNSYEALKKTYDTLKIKKDLEDLKSGKVTLKPSEQKILYELERDKAREAKKAAEEKAKADAEARRRRQQDLNAMNRAASNKSQSDAYASRVQSMQDEFDFDAPASSVATSSSTSAGSSFVSKYENTPIASLPEPKISGYLPAPKDRDD